MTLRQASGTRPFVTALVNGEPVSLMVHSNASFPMMLTHEVADRVGLADGGLERADYGIAEVGRLGGRGRRSAAVDTLQVGDDVARDVAASVFELPVDAGEDPVEGMLGIGWLRRRGVVVDLGRDVLTPHGAAVDGTSLRHHPDWDALVVDTVVGGEPAAWVVSTVAGVLVDSGAVERLGLRLGAVADDDGGPTGTVVSSRHVTGPWAVRVEGHEREVRDALCSDLYAYAAQDRRGDDPVAGFLGCDFLRRHGATVDFGRGVLRLEEQAGAPRSGRRRRPA